MTKTLFLKKLLSVFVIVAVLAMTSYVNAATSPSLGMAETFGILAETYTNTVGGTVINGDVGYITGPAFPPTVNGTTHVADADYTQAGIDQAAALALLNGEPCTHTFPGGAIDLAANVDFPTATYGPGVYCITGAASIGTGGITLNGNGTYIFRVDGGLNTEANSQVTMSGGADACYVWWTPTDATTLGANSDFEGTVIDAAGIATGANVTWGGRALAFGGTVSTDVDTITVPTCGGVPPPAPSATLTLVKTVINDDGGSKGVSDFPLFINGSPMTSGVATTTLSPGSYTASETTDSGYAASAWGGDCAANGSITLTDGDDMECTIINDDIEPEEDEDDSSSSRSGSRRRPSPSSLASNTSTTSIVEILTENMVTATTTLTVINGTIIPKLPNTGIGPGK
jgi:hypothetical protein